MLTRREDEQPTQSQISTSILKYTTINTFGRRWVTDSYWRPFFKTDNARPRFGQTDIGAEGHMEEGDAK